LLNAGSRSSYIAFCAALLVFLYFIKRKLLDVLIILSVIIVLSMSNPYMQYRMMQLAGVIVEKTISTLEGTVAKPQPKETEQEVNLATNAKPQPEETKQEGKSAITAKYQSKSEMIKQEIKSVATAKLKPLDVHIRQKIIVQPEAHIMSISSTIDDYMLAPFLGNGITQIMNKYMKCDRRLVEHNRYLYILNTAGILTLIPYVAFILVLIYISVRQLYLKTKFDKDLYEIGLVLVPSVILFAIQINNCSMERYYYWVFFGLAAAWVRNCYYERENENPAD
jgi:hypothetical protein